VRVCQFRHSGEHIEYIGTSSLGQGFFSP